MILIYSKQPLSADEKNKQINFIEERLSPFFINDDDFVFSTESNPLLIKEVIREQKVFLFFTKSITTIELKSDDMVDVISYLLKRSGCFWSEDENLTFGEGDIDILQNKIANLDLNTVDKNLNPCS